VNVTPWLEFVVEGTEYQLNKILKQISSREYEATQEKQLLDLNERQKNILSFLDQPSSKINNKTVQKMFKISAITAARDLAKLTRLGLLFTVGKGRSTYYTKA
jgi:Fic family protein